jgi:glycosyltransferase involved in cell wall biosynthesis
MNILFTRFPLESRFGGAEVQTLSLMKGLKERGHDVEFLGNCETLLRESTSYELRVTRLDIGKPPVTKWNSISFLWRKSTMKKRLINTLEARSSKLEAIVMLSMTEKLLVTEELAKRGHPIFWIEHDRIGRWLRMNPWLPQLRRMSQFATIVVVSELSKKMYIDLGFDPTHIVVIPNGIDQARFQGTPAHRSLGEGERHEAREIFHSKLVTRNSNLFHVGAVTRLTPDKGADVLIDAVSDLPEVNLTTIGTGPEEGFLRKIILDRNLSDRVILISHVDDLASFYSSLDAFVLPSRDHDPFGLVAAEAMSMGIPTIVTDQCGIADFLRDGEDALIVKAESISALQKAICKLRDDITLRSCIAENGMHTVREKFNVNTMVSRYEALFQAHAK